MSDQTTLPFTSASFERFLSEGKLMGARCGACGSVYLPPRAICARCHGEEMLWTPMSGRGTLAAFTSIYIAPTEMTNAGYGRNNPYLAGIVELDEGVKISARILGLDANAPQSIPIGTPLKVDFVAENEDQPVRLAFRPAD